MSNPSEHDPKEKVVGNQNFTPIPAPKPKVSKGAVHRIEYIHIQDGTDFIEIPAPNSMIFDRTLFGSHTRSNYDTNNSSGGNSGSTGNTDTTPSLPPPPPPSPGVPVYSISTTTVSDNSGSEILMELF